MSDNENLKNQIYIYFLKNILLQRRYGPMRETYKHFPRLGSILVFNTMLFIMAAFDLDTSLDPCANQTTCFEL